MDLPIHRSTSWLEGTPHPGRGRDTAISPGPEIYRITYHGSGTEWNTKTGSTLQSTLFTITLLLGILWQDNSEITSDLGVFGE
jgi:hypothetical protein